MKKQKNQLKYEKITNYIKSPSIVRSYSSISSAIFPTETEDIYLISVFFAYIREIFRSKEIHQLSSFLSIYENIYLLSFLEEKHRYNKEIAEKSLLFLKKINILYTKSSSKYTQDTAVMLVQETMKNKENEMAFIMKVSLWYFISKIKNLEKKQKIKENLNKKLKKLLKNKEIAYSKSYTLFISQILKVNISFYDESNEDDDIIVSFPYALKKMKNTLNISLFIDENKGIRILLKEDVGYREDKESLEKAEQDISELNNQLLKMHQKNIILQQKSNIALKLYNMLHEIPQILIENFNSFLGAIEKKEKSKELINKDKINAILKKMRKYENSLNLSENEDFDTLKTIKTKVNNLYKRTKKLFNDEESKDNDGSESQHTTITDQTDNLTINEEISQMDDEEDENQLIKSKQQMNSQLKQLQNSMNYLKFKNNLINPQEKLDNSFDLDKIIPDEEIVLKFDCPVCCESVTNDEIFSFGCEHRFCKTCMKNYLNSRYDNGQWGFEIQCMSGQCSYILDPSQAIYIVASLIGQEKADKMDYQAAVGFTDKQCFNCRYPFILDKDNGIPNVECPDCKKITCVNCGNEKHDPKVICKKIFEEMKLALNNDRMRCCPVCMEIYLKDDHCEHVKCLKCKTEFCYNCSAERNPTLGHGGHYHRRGCRYFFKKTDPKTKTEIMEDDPINVEKCIDCKKNGKPCKRPEKDLKSFYARWD